MLHVTTETDLGKREMRFTTRFFDFFGILMLVMGLAIYWQGFSPNFGDRFTFVALVICSFLCVPVYFLIGRYGFYRGDWQLDDEKVTFTSLKGKVRTLFWKDVKAFRFDRGNILFRGPGKIFQLIPRFEDDARWDEIRDFIRERLGDSFDFSERTKIAFTWRRKILCLGLGLLIGVPIISILYLQTMVEMPSLWINTEVILACILCWGLVFYLGWKEGRNRWRTRRESPK
jgi:hypothetical protein